MWRFFVSSERLQNMERELLLTVWQNIIEHMLISEGVVLDFYRQTGKMPPAKGPAVSGSH